MKTWIYRYKINGKTDKLTLGHYPTMSLANAKKRFMELSGLRKEGSSPKDVIEQQEQKETNTVKKLILEWYSGYAEKSRKRPLQIKQHIDADIIPLLGNMSLYRHCIKMWKRYLSHRSQRGSIDWKKYMGILKDYPLLKPNLPHSVYNAKQ